METLILFACLIAGITIRVFMKKLKARRLKVLFDWHLSRDTAFLSFIFGAVLILIRADLENLYPITNISILVAGYTGDSVLRNIIKKKGLS